MSGLPWFPLWVEKWRRSRKVRSVPRHIRSMYFDLLCEIWEQGPVTDDEEAARGLLSEDPRTFTKDWPRLRAMFIDAGGGRFTDAFLEDVRADQLAKNAKQAKRAKEGWAKRKAEAERRSTGDEPGMPRHSGGDEILDLRSEIKKEGEIAGARVGGLSHLEVELSKAWINAGLVGTIGTGHTAELAAELAQRNLAPLDACKAWRRLLAGMTARSGAITKQTPAKMLEHLRVGLITQVISGEVIPEKMAETRTGRRPDPPTGPRQPDGTELLAKLRSVPTGDR